MTLRLRHIGLTNFRSYEELALPLSGKPVVLTGQNGAGKTNLLEAISMLSAGRGMRHARLGEIARQAGDGSWAVRVKLGEIGGVPDTDLGVGVHAGNDKRIVRIDGAAAKPGDLLDYLSFLWLTPAQDRLFMDSPGERRKFLDRMVLAHDKAHGRRSTDYENAMRQRQKLFEQGRFDDAWLSGLEANMAENGVAIAAARRDMAGRLAAGVERIAQSVFPVADISLEGSLEQALSEASAGAVEEEFEARLKANRRLHAEAGRALEGPHRSDLLVTHREKAQAARLCSTGEQKALLIGLVLANAVALSARAMTDAPLVLLLDEVAAHLDQHRRAALFDILEEIGMQAFMTGTDNPLFETWGDRVDHFEVVEGTVKLF